MSDKAKTCFENAIERLYREDPLRPDQYVQIRQLKAFMKQYKRLAELGVEFSIPPKEAGNVKITVLDDTCGNYVQLMQEL